MTKEVSYAQFVRETSADFARMARIASRRRQFPSWYDVDDAKSELIAFCWHYGFERVSKDGTIGFNPARYQSAGAYLRWKVRTKVGKVISRARGEDQHSRRGKARPEYLSKTGELPEIATETAAEVSLGRARKIKSLERLAETTRDFVMLRALGQRNGDDRRVVGYLLDQPEETRQELGIEVVNKVSQKFAVTDAETAYRAVECFVDDWSKKHGEKPLPKPIPQAGAAA